jgi:hypothetical protein
LQINTNIKENNTLAITSNEGNIPLNSEIETRMAVQDHAAQEAAKRQELIHIEQNKRDEEETKRREDEQKKREGKGKTDKRQDQGGNRPGLTTEPQAPEKLRQEAVVRQANRQADQDKNTRRS